MKGAPAFPRGNAGMSGFAKKFYFDVIYRGGPDMTDDRERRECQARAASKSLKRPSRAIRILTLSLAATGT
jgi:hypothetical protein